MARSSEGILAMVTAGMQEIRTDAEIDLQQNPFVGSGERLGTMEILPPLKPRNVNIDFSGTLTNPELLLLLRKRVQARNEEE